MLYDKLSNIEFRQLARVRSTTLQATPVAILTAPGAIYGLKFINPNAAQAFIKFFDLAAGDVTVGTSPVQHTVMVPANDGTNDGVCWISADGPLMGFAVAAAMAAVTERADSGTTAPAAALIAEIFCK